MRFPMRCDQYELRPEPAAPGKWRGGVGIIRRNRFLVDGTYSCEGDRQTDPPQGVFGGWDGLVASCRKNPDTPREEVLPAKVTGIPFARRRVHRVPRAERGRLRRPARAARGGGARGRARRLHDDRARPRRVRRRLRGRADARDRRGGDRGAAGGAARRAGPAGSLDRVLRRPAAAVRSSTPDRRSPATASSASRRAAWPSRQYELVAERLRERVVHGELAARRAAAERGGARRPTSASAARPCARRCACSPRRT